MISDSTRSDAQGQIVLDALRRIVQALRQASKDSERSVGLSTAQLFVLRQIAASGHPLSINQLAEKTATHQSSVSVVVKKLVHKGLVIRQPAAHDSRYQEVSLSAAGRDGLSQLPPLIQDRLLEGFARMSVTEQQALVTGLQAFVTAAGLEAMPGLFFEDTP